MRYVFSVLTLLIGIGAIVTQTLLGDAIAILTMVFIMGYFALQDDGEKNGK